MTSGVLGGRVSLLVATSHQQPPNVLTSRSAARRTGLRRRLWLHRLERLYRESWLAEAADSSPSRTLRAAAAALTAERSLTSEWLLNGLARLPSLRLSALSR